MSNTDPVLQRTWQFNLNNIIEGASTQAGGFTDGPEYRKELLLAIKNAMIGFGTLPWTVAGSASFDTGVGAMDAVDRWSTIVDLRWTSNTGNNRSWIVLENSTLGLQFLFDCRNAGNSDGSFADCFVTPTSDPFVGGAVNARPTSPSEAQILDGDDFGNFGSWGAGDDNNNARSFVLHVMHSTDGLATRVITLLNGNMIGFWQFERIEEQIGTLDFPWLARVRANSNDSSDHATVSFLLDQNLSFGQRNTDAARVNLYLSMPGNDFAVNSWTENTDEKNAYDGRSGMPEVGVACEATGHIGFLGVLYDIWWATGGYTGRGRPGTTNAQMQFAEMVFPWDGSIPLIS